MARRPRGSPRWSRCRAAAAAEARRRRCPRVVYGPPSHRCGKQRAGRRVVVGPWRLHGTVRRAVINDCVCVWLCVCVCVSCGLPVLIVLYQLCVLLAWASTNDNSCRKNVSCVNLGTVATTMPHCSQPARPHRHAQHRQRIHTRTQPAPSTRMRAYAHRRCLARPAQTHTVTTTCHERQVPLAAATTAAQTIINSMSTASPPRHALLIFKGTHMPSS